MNKYKQFNIIENCSNFFEKIQKLKLYIIKFNKNDAIKPKFYPSDCAVKKEN